MLQAVKGKIFDVQLQAFYQIKGRAELALAGSDARRALDLLPARSAPP